MQAKNQSYWQRIPEDSSDATWSHWVEDRGPYHSSSYNHWHRSFIQEEEDDNYRRYQSVAGDTRTHWGEDTYYEPETDYPEYFTTDGACNQQVSQHANEPSNEFQEFNKCNANSFPKASVYRNYSSDPLGSEAKESKANVQSFLLDRKYSKNYNSSERNDLASTSFSVSSAKFFGKRLESRNWVALGSEKRNTETLPEEKSKKPPFVEKSISNLISKLFSEKKSLDSNVAKKGSSSANADSLSGSIRKQTGNIHNKDKVKSPLKAPMGNSESFKKKDNVLNHWKMTVRPRENYKCSVGNSDGRMKHHSGASDPEKKELCDARIQRSPLKGRRLLNGINGSISCNVKDYKHQEAHSLNFSKAVKSVPSKLKSPTTPNLVSPKNEANSVSPQSASTSHSDCSEGPPLLSPQKTPKKSEIERDVKENTESNDKLKDAYKNLQLLKKRIKVSVLSEDEMLSGSNLQKAISKEKYSTSMPVLSSTSSRPATSATFEKISKLHDILNSVMKTSLRDVIRSNIDISNETSEHSADSSLTNSFLNKMDISSQSDESPTSDSGKTNLDDPQTYHKMVRPDVCSSHETMADFHNFEKHRVSKQNIFLPFHDKEDTSLVVCKENKARKHLPNSSSTIKSSCQLAVVTRKQAALKALITKQKLKKKRKKFKGGTYDLYLSLMKRKKKKTSVSEGQSLSSRDDTSNAGTGFSSYSDDSFNTVQSSQTLPEMPYHDDDDDSVKNISMVGTSLLGRQNPSVLCSVMKTSLSHAIREGMKVNSENRAFSDSEVELNKDASEENVTSKAVYAFNYVDNMINTKHSINNFRRVNNELLQKVESLSEKKKSEVRFVRKSVDTTKSSLTEFEDSNQTVAQSQHFVKLEDEHDRGSDIKHISEDERKTQVLPIPLKTCKAEGKSRIFNSRLSSKRYKKRYLRSSFQHERYATIASGVKSRMRLKRKFPEDHFDIDAISFSRAREPDKKKKKKKVVIQSPLSRPRPLQQKIGSNTARKAFKLEKNKPQNDKSKEVQCIEKVEQIEDELASDEKPFPISMCTCLGKPLNSTSSKIIDGIISCQAVDSIDGELVNCCNNVTNHNLVRPSLKIPYIAMCEVHLLRLRHHQCCPSCGIFCTQGKFLQCVVTLPFPKNRQQIHFFHEHCQVSQQCGLPPICPHCGNGSGCRVVKLELNNYGSSSLHRSRGAFYTSEEKPLSLSNGIINVLQIGSDKNMHILKGLSPDNLSFGPDKFQLQTLLSSLSYEKPLNLRCSGKSLFSTIKSGDVEKVLHMLSMGFDPNHKFVDHHLSTPLHIAAAKGWSMIVHILVQYGASLDHVNDLLYTPLMLAVEKKHIAIVQYLIKAGALIDSRGEDGLTCLHVAAKCGSLEICKMLLKTGKIDVNVQDDGGWTSLVWAAEYKHIEVVKLLLNHGGDPNIRDNEENIALHWSSFSGNVDICHLLLDVGCELLAANKNGDTPLHIAARQYSYECIVLFLARGADTEIRNAEGETPIMCCADKDTQTWMALSMNQELKRRRANVKQRGEQILSQDISRGKEKNQIQCVNDVDDEMYPTDFLYVLENCETTPINIDRTITSLQSCQCKDECTSQACTCSSISLKCWYDRDGVLLPDFNALDPPMVFECNRACLCWQTCKNRVVQKGITSRLQLFRTKHKGWGVRTLKDIPKGVFICEYVGEIITDSEADRREDDSYLFDLDNRDGDTYCLDAKFYGNISRFINHNCDPNLVPVKVFVDHQDLCFPRISFFSTREIKAYEELGFDYGEKFWVVKCKRFLCVCGSLQCKYSKDAIDGTLERYFKQLGEQLECEQAVES